MNTVSKYYPTEKKIPKKNALHFGMEYIHILYNVEHQRVNVNFSLKTFKKKTKRDRERDREGKNTTTKKIINNVSSCVAGALNESRISLHRRKMCASYVEINLIKSDE